MKDLTLRWDRTRSAQFSDDDDGHIELFVTQERAGGEVDTAMTWITKDEAIDLIRWLAKAIR